MTDKPNEPMKNDGGAYKVGDIFTINGQYKRRGFLQWIRREPKELQKYVIVKALKGNE